MAHAGVPVENFRVGVMERLGLSYEMLREHFPKPVYAPIRGFGDSRTGRSRYADWPAFDIVAQAMGGIMGITGSDPEHPVKRGPAWAISSRPSCLRWEYWPLYVTPR